jgi:hypothetical protein
METGTQSGRVFAPVFTEDAGSFRNRHLNLVAGDAAFSATGCLLWHSHIKMMFER